MVVGRLRCGWGLWDFQRQWPKLFVCSCPGGFLWLLRLFTARPPLGLFPGPSVNGARSRIILYLAVILSPLLVVAAFH
ncbi:MAG: hypothetical protein WB948_05835, partial [Desulfobaccales bacterium]